MNINIEQGKAKRLNHSVLKPGDIVLTTTSLPISKLIRTVTASDISHAMLYVQNGSVIDADSEGVHARNTQRLFYSEDCAVYVLRLRNDISSTQLETVITYMRGHIGTEYSAIEASLSVIGGLNYLSKKQFCSRIVAQAFATAGITLVKTPNYCSPNDLKTSPFLISVENPTIEVTAEEAAAWEGIDDAPQIMRDTINIILNGAREKDLSIQNFDDLHSYLIRNPEHDNYFCKLLETSNYLSLWKLDKQKNPWHYNLNLMSASISSSTKNQVEDYCWGVVKDQELGPSRYIVNRGGYLLFSQQYDLHFFHLMAELYDYLAELHRIRVDVAIGWLEQNEYLPYSSPTHFIPHTPEWFTALEKWDPTKAIMVRTAIKLAGSEEVCSICGDDPAQDYRLEEELKPAGGVDTLRLCDTCVQIRKSYGDLYLPLS